VPPLNRTSLPAERSDASALSLPTGNFRCASTRNISWPTMPVAPTTATFKASLRDMCGSLPFRPRSFVQIGEVAQAEERVQPAGEPGLGDQPPPPPAPP